MTYIGNHKEFIKKNKSILKIQQGFKSETHKTIQKLINFDDAIKKETKKDNPNWPEIPDHPYRILIIGGTGSGETNSLFNLINQQSDIDKIDLYVKDINEAKYQF